MRDVHPSVAEEAAQIHGDFYWLNVTHWGWWAVAFAVAAVAFPFGLVLPALFVGRAIHTESGLRNVEPTQVPSNYVTRSDLMVDD